MFRVKKISIYFVSFFFPINFIVYINREESTLF